MPHDTLTERPVAGVGAGRAPRKRVASPLTSPRASADMDTAGGMEMPPYVAVEMAVTVH